MDLALNWKNNIFPQTSTVSHANTKISQLCFQCNWINSNIDKCPWHQLIKQLLNVFGWVRGMGQGKFACVGPTVFHVDVGWKVAQVVVWADLKVKSRLTRLYFVFYDYFSLKYICMHAFGFLVNVLSYHNNFFYNCIINCIIMHVYVLYVRAHVIYVCDY